jgi:hypothetical protein
MKETPSQTEMDEVFCAFYELSHKYKMIYGVDCETLIKVLEFWNELGKKEIDLLKSLIYDYNEDRTIVGVPIRSVNDPYEK